MLRVPGYGANPVFSAICFCAHGRVVNLVPSPLPVVICPLIFRVFNGQAPFLGLA